jgi:hypothetical protein
MQIYITIVELILIVIPLSMIILEVFLSFNKIKGDTISGIVNGWAYGKGFFITLAWGIVTGHLFLGAKVPWLKDSTISVILVAVLAIIAALLGRKMKSKKITRLVQAGILVAGTIIGHFIWSMNDYN